MDAVTARRRAAYFGVEPQGSADASPIAGDARFPASAPLDGGGRFKARPTKRRRLFSWVVSLREAAAIIFSLTAILPFLVFLSLLNRLEVISKVETQVSVLLAILTAILGFVVFRLMADRISKLARLDVAREGMRVPGLGTVVEIERLRRTLVHMLDDVRGSTDQLKDLVVKLISLNEMVELAARIPQMQDLLDLILSRTMRMVRATIGSIMLLDPERRALRVVAAQGLPDEVVGEEVKLGEGVPGQVAQLGEPVLIEDIETDPRFTKAKDPKYGSGSFIGMPIRVGDRVIGVINLARKDAAGADPSASAPFTAMDLRFLTALTTSVAYALDNARLLEETKQANTRLQKVIDELKTAQEQLVRGETLRAMGVLASGVAHHLNNVLAVIQGRVQLLLREIHDPAARRSLEIADRAGQEAAEVVRRLGDFSRAQLVPTRSPVDLNRLVEEAVELTRPHWQDDARLRGIQIHIATETRDVPAVLGEAESLREALMSLLLNAVDALPRGGRITVRTWGSADSVHVSVADTGIGMPEEVRQRALEPFFTAKGPDHVGLGLSVTYGIIQRHGGDLAIESVEGGGTTVEFRFPHAGAGRHAP